MRSIEIHPVLNGWIVKCGCQLVVYDSEAPLLADFTDWVRDPNKAEERIQKDKDRFGQFKKGPLSDRIDPPCDAAPTVQAQCCPERTGPSIHGLNSLESALRAR